MIAIIPNKGYDKERLFDVLIEVDNACISLVGTRIINPYPFVANASIETKTEYPMFIIKPIVDEIIDRIPKVRSPCCSSII